jgi:hypothetical protein
MTLRLTPLWKRRDGTIVRDFTIAAAGATQDQIGPHA